MPDLSRHLHRGGFSLSAPGVIFLVYVVLFLLSIRYYHSISNRDPTSFFFDLDRAYERQYSSTRVTEAEAFVSAAGDAAASHRVPAEQPELCIGVVSVRRRDQYVGLTVASILDGLGDSERNKILLYLRIGNTDPSVHPIYSEKWIETLPDRLLTYSKDNNPDFAQLKE